MRMLQDTFLAHKYRATLSDLLAELETDSQAMSLFEEFYPGVWDDLAEQGYECLALEQLPQAIRIFSFLLKYHPHNPAYSAAYADAQYGMRNYIEAATSYLETSNQVPDVPDAHFYLAEIWLFFQHPKQALERLQQVKTLLQDDTTHYLHEKTEQYISHAAQQSIVGM